MSSGASESNFDGNISLSAVPAGGGMLSLASGTLGMSALTTGNLVLRAFGENTSNAKLLSEHGQLVLEAGAASADAIQVKTSDTLGGIEMYAAGGGFNVTSTGDLSLRSVGSQSHILVQSEADHEDLKLEVSGGRDSGVHIVSDGTNADAISVMATSASGGVDIEAGVSGSGALQASSGSGGMQFSSSGAFTGEFYGMAINDSEGVERLSVRPDGFLSLSGKFCTYVATGASISISDECTVVLIKGSPGYKFALGGPAILSSTRTGQLLIVMNNSDSPSSRLVTMGGQSRIFIHDGSSWQ